MKSKITLFGLLATFAFLSLPLPAEAQLGRIAREVRGELTRAGTRAIVGKVSCEVGNTECVEEAKRNGEEAVIVDADGNVVTDKDGNPITDPEAVEAAMEEPGTGRWVDYDYLRGAVPIFNTWWNILDEENPPVTKPNPDVRMNRIPDEILYHMGNMKAVMMGDRLALEVYGRSVFHVVLPEELPDDFSFEYTVYSPGNAEVTTYFEPVVAGERKFGEDLQYHFVQVSRSPQISFAYNAGSGSSGARIPVHEEFTTVEFMVDDGYAVMYVNGEAVSQIPDLKRPAGSNVLEFFMQPAQRNPVYISDIRVDYGVEDPVELFEGEAAAYTTRSIFFDFNSARLRPESTPELERIRRMLEDVDGSVVIEGHTDGIGAADYNQTLSEERAQSVVDYLADAGVDRSKMTAVGRGMDDPVATNDTREGRQENRRVVVKKAG